LASRFNREFSLTNRRCRDVQFCFLTLRARGSRWTGWTGIKNRRQPVAQARELLRQSARLGLGGATYPVRRKHQSPPSISFRLPGAEGWVLSAPRFRLARVSAVAGRCPRDFNVRPPGGAPGFTSTKMVASSRKHPGSIDVRGIGGATDLKAVQSPTRRQARRADPPTQPQLPSGTSQWRPSYRVMSNESDKSTGRHRDKTDTAVLGLRWRRRRPWLLQRRLGSRRTQCPLRPLRPRRTSIPNR